MYVRARTKSGSVGGGPVFWLVVGPFILSFYVLAYALKYSVVGTAWCVREISAHRRRTALLKANASAPIVAAPMLPPEPEDAVPPGYMPHRPRA